jgi:hypothetical protein
MLLSIDKFYIHFGGLLEMIMIMIMVLFCHSFTVLNYISSACQSVFVQ